MDDVRLQLTGHVLDWIDGEISGGAQFGVNQSYLLFLKNQSNHSGSIDPGVGLGRYPGGYHSVEDVVKHLVQHGRTIRLYDGTYADIKTMVSKAFIFNGREVHYSLSGGSVAINYQRSQRGKSRVFDIFWFDGVGDPKFVHQELLLDNEWYPSLVEEIAKQLNGFTRRPVALNTFSYTRPKYNARWVGSNNSAGIWYPLTNNIVIDTILKQPSSSTQSGGLPQKNQSFLSAGVPKNTSIKTLSKIAKPKDPQYGISMQRPWSVETHDHAIRNSGGYVQLATYLVNPSSGRHFVFKRIAPPNDVPTLDRTRPPKYYYRGRGYRSPGLSGWVGSYVTVASLVHLEANNGLYCISIGDDLKDNAFNTPPTFTYNDGDDSTKRNLSLDGAAIVIRGNNNRVRINIYESFVMPIFDYRNISFLQIQGANNFVEIVFYGKLMVGIDSKPGSSTFQFISSGNVPMDYNNLTPITAFQEKDVGNQIVIRSGYGFSIYEHIRSLNKSIAQYGDPVGTMNPANYQNMDTLLLYSYTYAPQSGNNNRDGGLADAAEPVQWGAAGHGG